MKVPVRAILKPSRLSMIAVAASFAAWKLPSFGVLQKGFDTPSRLDINSGLVLACWYLLIFASFTVGEKTGELAAFLKPRRIDQLIDLDSNLLYYAFSLVGASGLMVMLVDIFRSFSWQEMILYISLGEANEFKEAWYADYSIGLISLRYVILFSSSIALYRIFRSKDFSLINLVNVLMLALLTFMSFRLILIAATVATVFLLTFGRKSVRVSGIKIAALAGCLFLILSALNISRNAAYYQVNGLSFWQAGVSEIDAYLGTPFQVALGAAPFSDQLAAGGVGAIGGEEPYRLYVDIQQSYMTNSAFVHMHQQHGYLCWPYIAAICCFMGFLFESLASIGKTMFLLPCGAILYGSAELWRLDLYEQGTFAVWMIVGIGLPAFMLFAKHLLRFVARLYHAPLP